MVEIRAAVLAAAEAHRLPARLVAFFGRSSVSFDDLRHDRVRSEWELRSVVAVIDAAVASGALGALLAYIGIAGALRASPASARTAPHPAVDVAQLKGFTAPVLH